MDLNRFEFYSENRFGDFSNTELSILHSALTCSRIYYPEKETLLVEITDMLNKRYETACDSIDGGE